MEESIGGIQLRLAGVYLTIPDKDKALSYAGQAFSLISGLSNDSLKAEANNTYGNVYLARNEKTMALRHYLNALRIAEETKQKIGKPELMRNCYLNLSGFYSGIEDYDKAIDYHTKALKKLDEVTMRNAPYQKAMDMNSIGNLFSYKKNYDMAIGYFERSIAMADSLKFSTLKIPGYVSLLNQYLRRDEPEKALSYMKSGAGQTLVKYLTDFGLSGSIDQSFAVIYTELKQYDSARFYFLRAVPYFEKNTNENNKIYFYRQLATFYKKTGETGKAINYFQLVKQMGERIGSLENVQVAAGQLDSLYLKQGNYLMASQYNGIYYTYKDSIEKLNREKELTQVEAADEQMRQERLQAEKLEQDRRRNNIQYMGITLGIVALFVALVLLGMFKVSATTIKMIGFFAFLMFFEFIFLLFKKNIHSFTHGEPWKDLLFMISLAALLLPFHHWAEHKVISYLTSHNRLTKAGQHIKSKFMRRTKSADQ
jgi:tetratricopeptide (TPR) repeat protein